MINKINKRLIMGVVAASVTGIAQAEGFTPTIALENIYITGHVGTANSSTTVADVQQAFNEKGVNATVETVDDNEHGKGFGLGYQLTPEWSLELGYLDLAQVDVRFTSAQAVANLEAAHPESGDGVTFSAVYRHQVDDKAHVRARAGLFDWSADYDTFIGPGGQLGEDSDSGTDLYWGLGFGVSLSSDFTLTTELQRFEFSNEERDYVLLGLEWQGL